MKTVVTILVTIIVVALLAWLAVGVVAWTGAVNVAANEDFVPGAEWFFGTLSENSIRKQAANALESGRITAPEEITKKMLDNGRHHYVEMCVVCHGAPGVERGELGAGLKPEPPDMPHVAEEMAIEEIYWVIENGIRHTGMPAYGQTHSSDEMWAIAAFVEELESMSPEEYERQTASGSHGSEGHEHETAEEGESSATNGDGHEGHTH